MSANMARNGLRAPVNITWEITFDCMLRCRHCLSDAGHALADELDTDQCRRLIDEFSRLKVFQVNIGGGEPFIRDDFLELLDYAHERGVVTCVSTNGMLIDDQLSKHLSRLKNLYLQLSLDGATAEINDPIRGAGTYKRILSAADSLASNGVDFSINTVLTRMNYPQLDEMRNLARGYGAELRVSRFRPSGRARDSHEYLAPSADQLEAFADWLEGHDLVRTGDSFFCLTSENRRRKGLDMCGAAKMTCCITPAGDVYPCAFLQVQDFWVGNIRDVAFKTLWDHSPVFKGLRNLKIDTCESCDRFDICRGGCPAVAYHRFGDIHRPDPECLVNLKTGGSVSMPYQRKELKANTTSIPG
ncbi:MAG: mycofactocin radical SAM maturase [Deltaproteobacteria bacterium]|jgi:mycofactocin biosynthetic radical S-adenosylmethionine protein MftC|nr:mycofactocin radical SAM maturase [Deltaproteobacteria bacterium]MBT4639151.1 mycofactocin radical SAM maturase [Deltaproteobacteria bacterium]MBT6500508.1 mycofactocin radical SAM maturase [Deltaproteobacteria bacterium]MBT7712747.1 mycofactocin radical SAM maturase [Deltaproteobacteria bacterium]MBT7893333.1 mycofactocin radical SAM maturase [Deltaproteobacteria bacterium]